MFKYVIATLALAAATLAHSAGMSKSWLGLNDHLLWFDAATRAKHYAAAKSIGAGTLRLDIHWDRIELTRDKLDLAALDATMNELKANKLEVLPYLVGTPAFLRPAGTTDATAPNDANAYAARLAFLARRYPWVRHWQIWNEPNLPSFWTSAKPVDDYAALVSAVSATFRGSADLKDRKLVLGAMSHFSEMPAAGGAAMFEGLSRLGVFAKVDVVAYHPYEDYPDGYDGQLLARLQWVNAKLKGWGATEIWVTETGWSTYAGPVEQQPLIGEATQADFLVRHLGLLKQAGFDRVFLFTLSDLDARATVRDRAYGLMRLDGRYKPSFDAVRKWWQALLPTLGV